jgi:hypothetical protein
MIITGKEEAVYDGQVIRFLYNHLNDLYKEIEMTTFKEMDIIDKRDFIKALEEAIRIMKETND